MSKKRKTVVVTGDVIHDHQIYLGKRMAPDSSEQIGTQITTTHGGAGLLFDVLKEVGDRRSKTDKPLNPFTVEFGLREQVFKKLPASLNAYSLWSPFPAGKKSIWRMSQTLGYGRPEETRFSYLPYVGATSKNPNVVVIDDGGLGFRHGSQKDAWPNAIKKKARADTEWVVLKMSSPLGQGDLWRHLTTGFKDKLIVIVSIGDIRKGEVRVSRGISWEQTALDLVEELCFNAEVSPLLNCRHLIVHFGSEGAVHVENTGRRRTFHLAFDPGYLEREWGEAHKGAGFGFMACLTGGLIDRLLQPGHSDPIHDGIRAGLSAMRTLHESGHGEVGLRDPEFPLDEVVKDIVKPRFGYPWIPLPDPEKCEKETRKDWTIVSAHFEGVELNPRPLYGVGRRVAMQGARALTQVPSAQFGHLFSADRKEIESLRGIRTLIRGYKEEKSAEKPLSIAVFGPPGAGKSFGIKQIAKGILGKDVPILEFNLSQFRDPGENPGDLIDAFHRVRDEALRGVVPVVFWDEFDSKEYVWLQYLLAPMQDGMFLEGQISHPIGKSIFIFAGGTSYDMENFGPNTEEAEAFRAFKLKKGPDFKSRLSGYLNVLGPNPRQLFDRKAGEWRSDPLDVCFPIRRALLLRSMLGFRGEEPLKIDHGILSAIIETKRFAHGARSLEKIASQLKRPGSSAIRRSDLPSEEILSMHADPVDFLSIVNRDLKYRTHAGDLAPFVHEYYRALGRKEGWLKPEMDKAYDDLPQDIREDNRAAAARIPQILDLIGLYVVPQESAVSLSPGKIRRMLEANIELLAEAEHNDWMHQKHKDGWVYGEDRDDEKKIHNCLRPYVELSEKEKQKDRNSVLHFPAILKQAKYKIVARL